MNGSLLIERVIINAVNNKMIWEWGMLKAAAIGGVKECNQEQNDDQRHHVRD